MSKSDKGVVKRYVVSPDKHVPLHDVPACRCLLRAVEIIKPDGYIDLGDVGDWESASHWMWEGKKRPPIEYQIPMLDQDIESVSNFLLDVENVCDKAGVKTREICQGNHEVWLDNLVRENPLLKSQPHAYGSGYMFKDILEWKKRKWKIHPAGKVVKLGGSKLYMYHGHIYATQHHTKNHLLKMGVNIIYGHHHDHQQHSITHINGEKSAWSIGCLKSLRPEDNLFVKGGIKNWGHGFAVVDIFDKGHFTVHVVRIIEGKCSLWGEVISGNKKT